VIHKGLKLGNINSELEVFWIRVGEVMACHLTSFGGNKHCQLVLAEHDNLFDSQVIQCTILPNWFVSHIHPVIGKGFETNRLEIWIDQSHVIGCHGSTPDKLQKSQ
jgi:hypothetical protein